MPNYQQLRVADLIVDPDYQREIKENHVAKMVRDWDEAQIGVLEVSLREDGTYAVFDGQQRLEAANRLKLRQLPCLVHTGLDPEGEAELFTRLQDNRVPITPLERFKARVFYGDPIAKGMHEITEAAGYQIGAGPRSLQGVVAVERIYRRGNLKETLELLDIWRGDEQALWTGLVDGVSRFLEYYPEADLDRCREVWGKESPTVIKRRTAEYKPTILSSNAFAVLQLLRDSYATRQFPLPTVANAIEAKRNAIAASRRTYKRVAYTDFRDAMVDMKEFSVEDMMEKLGVSRDALSRRDTGFIAVAIQRGTLQRYSPGGRNSGYRFRYIPPEKQKGPRRRPRGSDRGPTETQVTVPEKKKSTPVRGTGKKPKVTDPNVRALIAELAAGGARAKLVSNGHWEITQEGLPKTLISNTPSNSRSVLNDRTNLRKKGYKI